MQDSMLCHADDIAAASARLAMRYSGFERWLADMAANTPIMAQEAMEVSVPVFPLDTLCSILSILLAENVAKIIHPMEHSIIVHTAIVSASSVIGSVPRVTPTAAVPRPTAMDSNITEPISDSLIQPTGAPTVTSNTSIPLSTTMEGLPQSNRP